MSNDYTPSMGKVRRIFSYYGVKGELTQETFENAGAQFDRCIAAHDAEMAATALSDAQPTEWNENDHRGRTDEDNSRWDWLSGQWVERYGHRSADSVREIARFSHSMEIWFTDDLLGEPDPDAPGVES